MTHTSPKQWLESLLIDLTARRSLTDEEVEIHQGLIFEGEYDEAELFLTRRGFRCSVHEVRYDGYYEIKFDYQRLV